MSGSVQSGSGDTVTQLDPQIKKAWLDIYGTAGKAGSALDAMKVPTQHVAGADPEQERANTVLNTLVGNDAGFKQLQGAQDLAQQVGAYDPLNVKAQAVTAAKVPDMVKANAFRSDAPNLGKAQTYDPATIGKAQGYDAALIDSNKVGQVDPGALTDINMNRYMNPYDQQVIDPFMQDWQRGLAIQKNQDKADMAARDAFGNSRRDVVNAATNESAQRVLASTLGGLRQQGYQQASGLAQSDLDRALQGQTTNVGTNLQIQGANQGSKNTAREFGASANNAVDQIDAAAKNASRQFGAGAQNTFSLTDAANSLDNSQFNAKNATDVSQYNAGQVNAGKLTEAGYQQAAGLTNAANSLTAQAANQSAGLTGNSQALGAAQTLGALGGQRQQMGLNEVGALNSQGALNRGIAQQGLDAATANDAAKRDALLQGLQAKESPFQIIPSMGSGGTSATNSSGKGLGI